MRSKRLARQLKRFFGDESMGSLDVQNVMAQLPSFLDDIDNVYQQLDEKAQMAQRSLELSSAELTQANDRLFNTNRNFDALLNSLGQGFLMFDSKGICLPVFSKACEAVLECVPAGRPIAEVLKVPENGMATFTDWLELLFSGRWEFDQMADVGPTSFNHSQGLVISLEYKPVQNAAGELQAVVVVATDKTAEFKAKEEAARLQSFANMVVGILRNKPEFLRFVSGSRDLIRQSKAILSVAQFNQESLRDLRRNLHTLKGGSATFGVYKLTERVHKAENATSEVKDFEHVRGILHREIIEIEAEFEAILKEQRSMLGDILETDAPTREIPISDLENVLSLMKKNAMPATIIQKFEEDLLNVPLKKILSGYDSQVQTVARRMGKKVAPIEFLGESVRVNPEQCDPVLRELVHIFTNIVVHGIEDGEQRQHAAKPALGQIRVEMNAEFKDQSHWIHLRVSDDGRGIDPKKIRERWKTSGFTEKMTEEQLIQLVFEPGFTMASQVTEYAGRGVGLNALKNAVEKFGGQVKVVSVVGQGTTFVISFPHPRIEEEFRPRVAV